MSLSDLGAVTGLPESEIAAAARGSLVELAQPQAWYVDRAWFQSAGERLSAAVQEFHRANPLAQGIAKEDLRARETWGGPFGLQGEASVGLRPKAGQGAGRRPGGLPHLLLDALLASRSEIVTEGDIVRERGRTVTLQEEEEQARAAIERAFEQAGLAVPSLVETLARSGVAPAKARSLLAILLREKRLVRIGDDLVFHATAIRKLRAMLAERRSTRFTVGEFKEWTGVSRKYAIPLLEFLDRERVTRRDGDARVIV